MVDWESLETQAQWRDSLQSLLLSSDRALYRALDVLFSCQTEDEARDRCTKWHNRMGFSASDAPLLTRIHEKVEQGRFLHEWEYLELRRRLPKYWKQLMRMSPHYHGRKSPGSGAKLKEREVSRSRARPNAEPFVVGYRPLQTDSSGDVSGVLEGTAQAPKAPMGQGTLF